MALHASELKRLLAQSNLAEFRSYEIKNSCQALGIRVVPEELPGGTKYLAQSLMPSADCLPFKDLLKNIDCSPGSTSRLSGIRAIPTCMFSKSPTTLFPAEICPASEVLLPSELAEINS
jgi:hypothetical protein